MARCAVASSARANDSTTPDPADSDLIELLTTDTISVPSNAILRTATAPVIDGVLNDPAWVPAEVIDQFTQVLPIEGAVPSQRTLVRVMYDRRYIYFAVRCFDTEPDRIISTQMRRDVSIASDDQIAIAIDPFLDRRNGFLFEMNPAGSRVDSLIENNTELARDWDGIWFGRTSIDERGWCAEIAIPFQTISFNPSTDVWGLNISRVIRRENESVRWASPRRDIATHNVGAAGRLEGIFEIDQGAGLDVKPFGVASFLDDNANDRTSSTFDAGLDVFYKFTPSTTLALTFNTDFAETEVDERRINLTRFPLFFPEKRDFFLQDAGIFEFGGIRQNPLPFQSRRIGIGPDGEQRDILVGAKFTGRVGGLNFGLLDVQMQDDEELGAKNLFVGRASYNVFDESQVGAIFTNGDPNRPGENRVGGVDINFRNSAFNGNRVLSGSAFVLASETPGVQTGATAYGFKFGYPNDHIDWGIGFTHIDEDYDAALGFVPRAGIREFFGNWRYRWRPNSIIRRIDSGVNAFVVTDLDHNVESEDFTLQVITVEFETGDQISFSYDFEREVLDSGFTISEGVTIPAGDYDWNRWNLSASTDASRPIRAGGFVRGGGFFSGDRFDVGVDAEWRASKHLFVGVEYEQSDIDLAEGDFITRIGRVRLNVFLTPDLSWTTFAQYDNVSRSMGMNSKVRWIFEPGSELFVVVNQGFDVDGSDFRSTFTELTSKIGWTFRF
jgi:hypothetical protein